MQTIHLHWNAPIELVGDFPARLSEALHCGVYAFTGRHYCNASDALLYIGKTDSSFYKRIWKENANREWLQRMSSHLGASFHYAPIEDVGLIKAVETALIHVHQPHYNSSEIVTPSRLAEHITVYNVGILPPHMLPIVATDYPWFGKENAFRLDE